MKIVHLSTSDRGGAGIAAARLHSALLKNGIDSRLLTLHKFSDNILNHEQYFPSGVRAFPIFRREINKAWQRLRYLTGSKSKWEKYSEKYLANRPKGYEHFSFPFSEYDLSSHPLVASADIVHLHWVSDGFLEYGSFFRKSDKKFVWSLHDMNPFTGGCHHADGCVNFRNDCMHCPQLKGTIDENISADMLHLKVNALKHIERNRMEIISPSLWLMNLSKSGNLFSRYNHSVIPNAFNTDIFKPVDKTKARKMLGLPIDKKIIAYNAHHIDNPRKGFLYLKEAMKIIKSENILFCAAGNEFNLIELPNLITMGYVDSEEKMAMIYSAADAFILPSVAENFPSTICEALLCGSPVISFDTGGIPELVSEENGRLVPPGKIEDLVKEILHVVNDGTYNRDSIHRKAKDKLDSSKVAIRHLEIYKRLMS